MNLLRQAQVKSARDHHLKLTYPFHPSKLGKVSCRYAVLRTIVSLEVHREGNKEAKHTGNSQI